ncbi:MAG: hypothetical protein ACRCUJ_08055 [Phocaeicola sp.]
MDRVSIALIFTLAAIVLLAIVLCSCGSSSKASKSNVEERSKESVKEELSVVANSHVTLSSLTTIDGAWLAKITRFDTDKPKDPDTGLHPVKEEVSMSGTFKKKEDATAEKADSSSVVANMNKDVDIERKEEIDMSTARKETTVPKQIGWLCAGFALLVVVIWLVRSTGKKQ